MKAHIEGCPKALSVPVDLCACGGREFLTTNEVKRRARECAEKIAPHLDPYFMLNRDWQDTIAAIISPYIGDAREGLNDYAEGMHTGLALAENAILEFREISPLGLCSIDDLLEKVGAINPASPTVGEVKCENCNHAPCHLVHGVNCHVDVPHCGAVICDCHETECQFSTVKEQDENHSVNAAQNLGVPRAELRPTSELGGDWATANQIAVSRESAYSGIGWSANDIDDLSNRILSALTTAREAERERCAKIAGSGTCCCDPSRSKFIKHFSNCAQYIAAAIRNPPSPESGLSQGVRVAEIDAEIANLIKIFRTLWEDDQYVLPEAAWRVLGKTMTTALRSALNERDELRAAEQRIRETQLHDDMEREAMRLTIVEFERDHDSLRQTCEGLREQTDKSIAAAAEDLYRQGAGHVFDAGEIISIITKHFRYEEQESSK